MPTQSISVKCSFRCRPIRRSGRVTYPVAVPDCVPWTDFADVRPDLSALGIEMFYSFDVGLGFLATVRRDGGPRVHPICPVFHEGHLYAMVIPGPKLNDLRRDSRFALHSETFPPPREDDGFYVTGTANEISDASLIAAIGDQFLSERGMTQKWPGFDDQAFFELLIDRALLTLTAPRDGFPSGSTVWRAA